MFAQSLIPAENDKGGVLGIKKKEKKKTKYFADLGDCSKHLR